MQEQAGLEACQSTDGVGAWGRSQLAGISRVTFPLWVVTLLPGILQLLFVVTHMLKSLYKSLQ